MAQQLALSTALSEDPSLVASTCIRCLFQPPWAPVNTWYKYMWACMHTYTYIKIKTKISKIQDKNAETWVQRV